METASHMGLAPLKVFAARLIALPLFVPLRSRKTAEEVLRRFCSTVAAEEDRSNQTLGAFLAQQLTLTERYCRALTSDEQAAVGPVLARLRTAVSGAICATCAGAQGVVCRNVQQTDDVQITHGGLCLRDLRDAHEHLVSRLGERIVHWGRVGDASLTASLGHVWGTAWSGAPVRQQPTPDPKVSAGTKFWDDVASGRRQAQVQLGVEVDELDWPSALMIPWLFAHEFVCHVQQTPAALARAPCRPACVFFEGWMDELAYLLVQADLASGWFGPVSPGFIREHRQAIFNAAQQYQAWRYGQIPGGNPSVFAPQWLEGVHAARAVLAFFEATVPDGDETERRKVALARLTALSFRVQGASPSEEQLDEVVERCLLAAEQAIHGQDDDKVRLLRLLTESIPDLGNWINRLRACGT